MGALCQPLSSDAADTMCTSMNITNCDIVCHVWASYDLQVRALPFITYYPRFLYFGMRCRHDCTGPEK